MVIKHHDPQEKITHLKEVIEQEEPPPLCHQPVPDGKSGNLKLPTPCGYCAHKWRCHPDLRAFAYSNGPRYLTKVAKVPDVQEFYTCQFLRSDKRRVGKEWVGQCRSRWSPY